MNSQTVPQLSPALQAHADAMAGCEANATAVDGAQQRLLARIAGARRPLRTIAPRMLTAAAAACAVLALGVVLFFGNLAAPGSGAAFADVQQQLARFEALSMQMVQRHQGTPLQETRITTVRDGRTRVDVGDQLSVIVDPAMGRATTLLHGPRQAMTMALPPGDMPEGTEALAWLEALRSFQGEALPLADTRRIDGQLAHGWTLEVDGVDIELWANDAGTPLEMTLSQAGGLLLDFDFDFSPQIARGSLDTAVPPGYQTMQ